MADTIETAQYFIYVQVLSDASLRAILTFSSSFSTQVYFCCMYAVVLWDWIISLPREWRFIWKTSWTPVKVAYLFCRYWVIAVVPYLLYAFVANHTQEVCEKIYKIPVALAMWNQVGSESVLLIRTYAFFHRNVYILLALIFALSGVVAYQLYVDASQMILLAFITPPKGPCFPASKPHSAHLLGFFIAPLLFDTLVTAMTVWKAFHMRVRNGGANSKLIQTFLREGVFYYILISIANLINGIFYLQPRQVISALNIPLSVMMAPLLACRLILDLKERGAKTEAHSEGTGVGAFATKSGLSASSNAPPRTKRASGLRVRHRDPGSTIASNIILSTVGSIQPDLEAANVELDEIPSESGMGFAGDSSRTLGSLDQANPTYISIELGSAARWGSADDGDETGPLSGILVNVEKTTSTL